MTKESNVLKTVLKKAINKINEISNKNVKICQKEKNFISR